MMIECNLMSMREWNYFLRILTGGVEGWNRIGDYCWGLPPPDPRVCDACLWQRHVKIYLKLWHGLDSDYFCAYVPCVFILKNAQCITVYNIIAIFSFFQSLFWLVLSACIGGRPDGLAGPSRIA